MKIDDELNTLGFALVSSNRNRILFFSDKYETTKRVQLHYMRNDLLYLFPVSRVMLIDHTKLQRQDNTRLNFDQSTCANFTINLASVLHVEMDLAPHKIYNIAISQISEPPEQEYYIHKNLIQASNKIEIFDQSVQDTLSIYDNRFSFVIKGYQMFQDFCRDNLGVNAATEMLFEKDLADETQYRDIVRTVQRHVTDAIMSMDYTDVDFDKNLLAKFREINNLPYDKVLKNNLLGNIL